ncbi:MULTISPECIES: VOC family protein [Paenibacillus]|uniref:VOC family protein n=1 Tax=Paenibacillus albilobatus TaxID=2716884 RepID=A0A920C9S4_9BACL|nr:MULTISPECIES: VOC family protein [Paenibacillus]MDR9855088.1 VOC family protein [Paenibacillus sp. VCA1]GIO29454.1 VOC family protein [Paenibacillus albilobatus]
MESKVAPFLMFEGQAEEAMNFYTSVFAPAEIVSIKRYGPNEAGPEGSVLQAAFSIKGQNIMCIDSFVQHAFTFTPAISLFVHCDSEEELTEAFGKLAEGGAVLMPLDKYPFAEKFGWVQDRFGVSWQLSWN